MHRQFAYLLATLALGVGMHAQEPQPPAVSLPPGAHYVEREFRLTTHHSFPQGLDALEIYVETSGKHPLALLTHGTAEKNEDRLQVTPWAFVSEALWFARRGYVVLVIVRSGYGISGGKQDSTAGGCDGGSFEDAGDLAADDLRDAVEYAAKHMPEADTSNLVSAGVSTGGFTQVALAAHPPAGLKAAINFAGGRGGNGKEHLCNESGLLSAFKAFGKHARVPMLWIYAENDKWFPPRFATKFEEAFKSSGGVDQFVLAPADGEDGHRLFGHVAAWSATVEAFLKDQNLLPLPDLYPPPPTPPVPPPVGLSDRGVEAFHNFLILGPNKAFASNGAGTYGSATGQFTQELANQHALENCNRARKDKPPCQIVSTGK